MPENISIRVRKMSRCNLSFCVLSFSTLIGVLAVNVDVGPNVSSSFLVQVNSRSPITFHNMWYVFFFHHGLQIPNNSFLSSSFGRIHFETFHELQIWNSYTLADFFELKSHGTFQFKALHLDESISKLSMNFKFDALTHSQTSLN